MTQGVAEAKAAEKRRLAEALRANLRRRKAAVGRGASAGSSDDAPPSRAEVPVSTPEDGERG